MGLGAPKRRAKLSHDPNNTTWSRSTSNFGHRILSQQGWQPGQYLGAENANHSDHYTAANASHIRILLREDNLGVGAKVGGNKAETFGLTLFSGVLGRLNGKSDEQVQKQQDSLRDAELRLYQVGKHGYMNFVSGGLLVGDRIERSGEKDVGRMEDVQSTSEAAVKKGKKRRAGEEDLSETEAKTKKVRKARKPETREAEDVAVHAKAGEDSRAERSRGKDKKKDKRTDDMLENGEASKNAIAENKSKKRRNTATNDDRSPSETSADEKDRLKQEKRARKEDRRKRKEAKRLKRAQKAQRVEQETQPAVPAVQSFNGGRHAVRHRYIQQKRMAGMDPKAMNEIFMIKGAA